MGRKKRDKKNQKQYFAEGEEKIESATGAKENAGDATKSAEAKITPEQVEREYADILNYQRKQRDNLLGNFSAGNYAIPDEIKAELLKIPKKFGEIEENVARVSTMLGRFVLNFKIVFTIDPDICNAKLYIIEIEHDLDEDIKHETLLDEFEQPHSFEFRKTVFEKWHVFYDDDVLVKDGLLQNYLHMQEEENLFFGELEMILSQLFVVRMLALLDKMGELGDKIRVDFKLAMEKFLAQNPKLAQDFTFQKRILDKFIAKHNALLVIAKMDEGAKILLGYSTPLKNVRDKTYPATVVEQKKVKEEKSAEKKASSATIKKKTSKPAKQASFKFDLTKSKLGIKFGGGGATIKIPNAQKPNKQGSTLTSSGAAAPVVKKEGEVFSLRNLKSGRRELVSSENSKEAVKTTEATRARDSVLGLETEKVSAPGPAIETGPEPVREAESGSGREPISL